MEQQTVLAPLPGDERIQAMDVLRGFALLGILLMNIEGFVGPLNSALTGLDPQWTGADRWADALIYIFVQGKFYPLFSLLFGMGFAVMMVRANSAGRPFFGVYFRRVLALLVIGVAHALLVWSGDILTTYALVAIPLLLFFRSTPQSRLPKWGIAFYLIPIVLVLLFGMLGSVMQLQPEMAAEFNKAMAAQADMMAATLEGQRQAFGSGTYAEAVAQRSRDLGMMLSFLWIMGFQLLGLFLLGAWFVRSGAIARPAEFPRLYTGLRWVGLPTGLAMTILSFYLVPTIDMARLDITSSVANSLFWLGGALMCLGYLAWIVRGLQSVSMAPRLTVLAPAGRMALTNYLSQSVICTLIFYGYGLGYFEQLPRAWQVPFVLVLFALQVAFSHWWLARFRFGPMEWLWRAATYLQLPPMRRA
jgi:uncharacterized protein